MWKVDIKYFFYQIIRSCNRLFALFDGFFCSRELETKLAARQEVNKDVIEEEKGLKQSKSKTTELSIEIWTKINVEFLCFMFSKITPRISKIRWDSTKNK